jgi:hypothetical protein
MTMTNAAATVARNPETGIKSSRLDLGLDSIVLLKRQHKSSVKASSQPLCGTLGSWRLYSITKGRMGHVVSYY